MLTVTRDRQPLGENLPVPYNRLRAIEGDRWADF